MGQLRSGMRRSLCLHKDALDAFDRFEARA